jgi:hypothetical protein
MGYKTRIESYTGDIDAWNGQDYAAANADAEQFISNGAKFVIDLVAKITPDKLPLFTTHTTGDWTSYTFTLGGGAGGYMEYFTNVYLTHSDGTKYECAPISADMARQAADTNSLHYAPAVSPVYYVSNSKVTVLPALGTPSIDVILTPRHDETDIDTADSINPTNFPDSYDDILILFASGKIIGTKLSYYQDYFTITESASHAYTALNSAKTQIGNALTEISEAVADLDTTSSEVKTAADGITTAVAKFRADASDPALFGDESQYTTGAGITGVQDALTKAENLIDGTTMGGDTEPESVQYWLNQEDTEMAQATLQAAQSEISRAQGHIAEWNAAVGALQAEINGFATELNSRVSWISAKAATWNAYFSSASNYIAEFNARFTKDTTTYQWLLGQKQLINTELMQALAAKGLAGAPAQ